MEDNVKTNGGMAGGLLVGMLIGALSGLAVGFLYAPRTGRETRDMIKGKASQAKESAADFISRVRTAAISGRNKAQELKEDVSETFEGPTS